MGYDNFPELYEQYVPDPSKDGGDVDPEWLVNNEMASQLQDFAEGEAVDKVKGSVRNAFLSKKVGFGMRMTNFALREVQRGLSSLAAKEFSGQIMKFCGERALKMLIKRAGVIRGTLFVGAIVIDGPLPIGDALAVVFAGMAAADVAHLAEMLWDGYVLSKEMDKRFEAEVEDVEVLGPADLITEFKRRQVLEGIDGDDFVQDLFNSGNVNMRIKRKGIGWEHWRMQNNKLQELVFYSQYGEYVAGIKAQELDEIETAYAQMEAQEEREHKLKPDSGFGSLPRTA